MVAIVAAIIAATGAGIWAERRYRNRAGLAARRSLLFVLYFILPPTTFLNLVHVHFDANVGIGIALGFVALAGAVLLAWAVVPRFLELSRPQTGSVLVCALLGFDALSQAVVYDVLVSGTALLLGAFSIGAAFGDRAGEGPRQRIA